MTASGLQPLEEPRVFCVPVDRLALFDRLFAEGGIEAIVQACREEEVLVQVCLSV